MMYKVDIPLCVIMVMLLVNELLGSGVRDGYRSFFTPHLANVNEWDLISDL